MSARSIAPRITPHRYSPGPAVGLSGRAAESNGGQRTESDKGSLGATRRKRSRCDASCGSRWTSDYGGKEGIGTYMRHIHTGKPAVRSVPPNRHMVFSRP